jgi:hypothetical protein
MAETSGDPTDQAQRSSETVRNSFQTELNLHGYGFQFSVLKMVQELRKEEKSKWWFRVSEFPVAVQGSGTKIDFILCRQVSEFWRSEMICECKRVNPAKANWCFIRAPYIHRGHPQRESYRLLESAILSPRGNELRVYTDANSFAYDARHVAVAVTSSGKGDSNPGSRYQTQIEDAATQVMRGVNGYIETLSSNPQLLDPTGEQDSIVKLVPVIFTTATLWSSHSDLAAADLATGKIDLGLSKFETVPWLWYQYNVSPGLKHSRRPVEKKKQIEDLMQDEYIRSIAIVSSDGIADFLSSTSEFL